MMDFTIKDERLWFWRGRVRRVVDGDTVDVVVDHGFNHFSFQRLRLLDVDTPELRSRDEQERAKAQVAKNRVIELCNGREILFRSKKGDSFGRWLATIYIDVEGAAMKDLGQLLIEEGLAQPWK